MSGAAERLLSNLIPKEAFAMRYHIFVSRPLVAVSLALLFALPFYAQTATTGTIIGTVTDRDGAMLASAEIELSNTATKQVTKGITNNDGQYVFPAVLPGQNNVTVIKQGFRKLAGRAFSFEVTKCSR